ncbi:dihydroorotate dehydrogenase [Prosthecochloris sp. HL-130-GSB]|jgi:dihydroorotate dehydrogenase (NAD+) catalytic subunit|uniref:Dihydroorotate dehydrogenase n=1 Tax=Prosthecochloris aestuarii TaxID=1102 RepID=A0A831WPT2_PROAE|nr:dihydroorotate dehydrogenase [Prosthecochloris sp. HL-130-GSB]ARM30412.1 dihydroorotate dehydrogenase B catalytic subunit [Prosthecochloris sp. HL-130-GSB]MBO8093292.1 dihydroorotate dehydrogenase [Prosthecochloris sp.]HED31838.1 dihydroorotate dehydrogenase [Prosthecochloris aestuarii]
MHQDPHSPRSTAVSLGRGLELRSPVLLASGTVSYGEELSRLTDLGRIGGIVTKAISPEPRTGNPPQRIAETPCGMVNAIGLANVGLERFVSEKVPFLQQLDTAVIVNIAGKSTDDYATVIRRLDDIDGIDAYEINLSCPNVKGECMIMGVSREATYDIIRSLRSITQRHLMVKLTPNVTSISSIALAAQEAGADSVSLINTLVGMAVDYRTRKPLLTNITGGLSGPAIKPVALAKVWEVFNAVHIPVIGMGGISSFEDAMEFLLTGARAVQIGTMNFVYPDIGRTIADRLETYFSDPEHLSLQEYTGSLIT